MRATTVGTLGVLGLVMVLCGCDATAVHAGLESATGVESVAAPSSAVSTSTEADTGGASLGEAPAEMTEVEETANEAIETSDREPLVDLSEPDVPPELAHAIAAAENYLAFAPFSKKGLIDQLSSEYGDGYPADVAASAVASLDVDWKEQAAKAATHYLEYTAFSKDGLIEQLESEYGDGYSHEEAVYGVEVAYGAAGPDTASSAELDNAIEAAQNYLSIMPFSQKGLVEQLSSDFGDGYSTEAATAAVTSLDVDWNEQAVKAAENYLDLMPFSRQELIDQLVDGDGYTAAQAAYGVGKAYQ